MNALEIALMVLSGSMKNLENQSQWYCLLRAVPDLADRLQNEYLWNRFPDKNELREVSEMVIFHAIESNQQKIAQLTAIVTELQKSIKTT